MATDPGSAIAIVLLVALASMVFNLIVQGSLVGATMTEIEGDHATLGAAIDGRFE